MKKYICLLVLLVFSSSNIMAQTLSNENFIYTAAPQKAVQAANYNTLTPLDLKQNVTYFDGLGRPIQSIAIKQGGNKEDIVTHIEYDAFGRQAKDYLPYAFTNVGNEYLKTDALTATGTFYSTTKYENTLNPFSHKSFEASPLNRVLKQAAPGNDWALNPAGDDHSIKLDYQTNVSSEVKQYIVSLSFANNTYTPTLALSTTNGGYYNINQLYKTITKDENWIASDLNNKTTEEFKDKEGRVVLKRTYNGNAPYDTYYVYDSYGNLTYVLPPKSEGLIDTATLNNLCYQYIYDYRNRLVEKKLPGKGWERIVYDKLDRPIMTQDTKQESVGEWIFTKYDAFGRVAYTGLWQTYTNRIAQQNTADTTIAQYVNKVSTANTIAGTSIYYDNPSYPITNISLIYTINYYDDYNFDLNGGVSETSYGLTPITNAKGLATGSKVRILGTTNWTTNVNYYDVKGRPIYAYSKNDYLGTISKVKSQLDFPGKTMETTTSHTRASVTTNVVDAFAYDNSGRLLTQKQTINSQAQEVVVSNIYDNMGQLISKGAGGKTFQNRLQNVDYTYNIRGWLKGINDTDSSNASITLGSGDLFGFQISYNNPSTGTPLYNGNISQTFWKTTNTDTALKSYNYTYDALNRLTAAIDKTSLTPNRYNESLSYDKNGNIMYLLRMGNTNVAATTFGTMDNLVYTYDAGNKLTKVEDSSGSTEGFNNGSNTPTEYAYDVNGNMFSDFNKGISSITYNYLNLPTQVVMTGGTINYVYDATGAKQQKIVNGITTDYAGGFNYEGGTLKFFSQPEGYVAHNSGTFSYIYQYKDHLGNVRLSYGDKNNNGIITVSTDPNLNELVEENNYYPFGLKQKGYNYGFIIGNGNAQGQKYKFIGQEWQDELGLNVYDFDNRVYDPATGRFWEMDPKAELGRRWTPYNYCFDNPVYFQDPDGMWPWPTLSQAKSFAKGFGNTIVGMVKGMAKDLKLMSGPLGPMGKIFDVASRVAPSAMKGDLKGTAKAMLNESGIPAVVNTVKKAAKGDAEAIGSVTAIVVVAVVAERVGGKTGSVSTAEAGEISTASSSANGVKLNKQLASEAQMTSEGTTIAGGETGTPLRKAESLAAEHGGEASDWVKKSSDSHTASDGTKFETHWEENTQTGERVNQKTKIETVTPKKETLN